MPRSGVAPYDLIQRDFRELDIAETLRTTWDTERLILMQAVQGHAHEGACRFKGTKYPNTTLDDVSRALRLDPSWVRNARQSLIDAVDRYVDIVVGGNRRPPLRDENGIGMLGSSMFYGLDVDGHDVLRGLYLGGLRDSPEYRFAVESKYNMRIGGGKCYLVDTHVMDSMGLDGDVLAHSAHEDMIGFYKQRGLIYADAGPDTDDLEYMYIRYRLGPGASDDAAVVVAGMLYNFGVAVGVFLADAIDTLEKYVPVYSDQDHALAIRIKEQYSDLDITDDEVIRLAYLCAGANDSRTPVPDSSLRHLMMVDRRYDTTLIESHFHYLQGKPTPAIRMGHEATTNHAFYEYLDERVKSA